MDFGIKNNTNGGVSLNNINNLNNTDNQQPQQNQQQQQFGQQNQQQPPFGQQNQQQQQFGQQNQQPQFGQQNQQQPPFGQQNQQQQQFGQQNQQPQFGQQNQQQPFGQQNQQQPFGQQNQQQQPFGQQNQQPFGQQNQQHPFGQQNQQQQQFGQQNQQQRPAATGVNLKKGQKVNLSKMSTNLDTVMVGLGWDVSTKTNISHDLDVEVFMLDGNDRILGDDWFVFYNKLISPDGSVKHSGDNSSGFGSGDDEIITVQLSKVNPGVKKLVFIVTINEAIERGHNFGQMSNAYIRIADLKTGIELIRFNLTEYYSNVISMVAGELYHHNGEWKFNPVGDGTSDDLIGLCTRYGVNVM